MDTTLARHDRDTLLVALIRWFDRAGRDLPWRRTRDPYKVLVSEVMLQQTQAARVVPAFLTFLQRFPTLDALASAPTAEVVQRWQGLGYNRRAINLQRIARTVVELHGGVMPATLDELQALPGVGPYTSRAVLAFAFEQAAAPVDVNVARVVQRAVVGFAIAPRERQRVADELVAAADTAVPGASAVNDSTATAAAELAADASVTATGASDADLGVGVRARSHGAAWLVAQALIELGATHCTARSPSCGECPIATSCAWHAKGNPTPDPGAATRAAQKPFAGSDRYHRGRLLDALRVCDVAIADIPAAAHTSDAQRANRLAASLVADGLAEWSHDMLALPERAEDPGEQQT